MWQLKTVMVALYASLFYIGASLLLTLIYCSDLIVVHFYQIILFPLYYIYAFISIAIFKYCNRRNTFFATAVVLIIISITLFYSRDFNVLWVERQLAGIERNESIYLKLILAGCREMFSSLSLLITTMFFFAILAGRKVEVKP
jgi:hypothetical protein